MGNLKKLKIGLIIITLVVIVFIALYTSSYFMQQTSEQKVDFTVVGHGYGYRGRMSKDLYKPLDETFRKIDVGDLVLFLGDNVEESKNEYYEGLFNDLNEIKSVKSKYYLSPGNHDIASKSARKRFLDVNSYDDTDYFFDKNGVRFISIDYSAYDKNTGSLKNIGGHNVMPEVSRSRLKKLKKYLSPKNLDKIYAVVIFTHTYAWDKSIKIHKHTKFMENIFPLLSNTKKPVYVFAGNTCLVKDSSTDNVRFLTTGLCPSAKTTKNDNILKVSIEKDKISSKVNFNYKIIHLRDYYDYSNIELRYLGEKSLDSVKKYNKLNDNKLNKLMEELNIQNIVSHSYDENRDLIYIFTQNKDRKTEILVVNNNLNKIIHKYKYEFSEKGGIIASALIKHDNLLTFERRNHIHQIRHIRLNDDNDDEDITGIGISLLREAGSWKKEVVKDIDSLIYDKNNNLLYIKNSGKFKMFKVHFIEK